MDDTFWKGTISETNISFIQNNIEIVKELTNRGIVNSICSKNDFDIVKEKLDEILVFDYFIFPSINWLPKGEQIKQIIEKCQLRAENVLFIDDNLSNIKEAEYYNTNIQTCSPINLENFLNLEQVQGKKDYEHKRLKDYKILEEKYNKKQLYSSNLEFLYDSNIQVEICYDCENHFDRISELIHRTNQLNFTRIRSSDKELEELISNRDINTGYVKVKDKFGDYGIVGFFAIKEKKAIHLLFSCRIIGLGIEQWIYSKLNYPIVEENNGCIVKLNNNTCPEWINSGNKSETHNDQDNVNINKLNILIKGGCDLSQIRPYLNGVDYNIVEEFNHLNYHRDHTCFITGLIKYSEEEKKHLLKEVPFLYENSFKSVLFKENENFDIVVISVLMDYTQGIYVNKNNPKLKTAFGDLNKCIDFANNKIVNLTEKENNIFYSNYKFIGGISEDEFENNLNYIYENLPSKVKLIIINGSEVKFNHLIEKNRYLIHKKMNDVVDKFVNSKERAYLLDVRKFIKNENDITDNIRHYKRNIYYKLAQELINIINSMDSTEIKNDINNISVLLDLLDEKDKIIAINKQKYNIISKLLSIKQKKLNFIKYFKDRNIKSIAIYGEGAIGQAFFNEIIHNIDVIFFIDEYSTNIQYNGIKVIKINDSYDLLSTVDAIIVTPVWNISEITSQINNIRENLNIISLETVLSNCIL